MQIRRYKNKNRSNLTNKINFFIIRVREYFKIENIFHTKKKIIYNHAHVCLYGVILGILSVKSGSTFSFPSNEVAAYMSVYFIDMGWSYTWAMRCDLLTVICLVSVDYYLLYVCDCRNIFRKYKLSNKGECHDIVWILYNWKTYT